MLKVFCESSDNIYEQVDRKQYIKAWTHRFSRMISSKTCASLHLFSMLSEKKCKFYENPLKMAWKCAIIIARMQIWTTRAVENYRIRLYQ